MEVLLFGDQTVDQSSLLRRATLKRDSAILSTFFERAALALREETRRLPKHRRDQVPDFLTIAELVENYEDKRVKITELESALLTVSQLAHFIGYYEQNPSQLPVVHNIRAVGLCTGLLAAAAVVSARSLSEIIPLAIEAVKISFRVGSTVGRAKDALEQCQRGGESWSTIVTNTSEKAARAALDDFHSSSGIPKASQAYVSAISIMAVTISGPPSTTRRLFEESANLKKVHRVQIPVFGPYHAQHLYRDADLSRIIGPESAHLLTQFQPLGLVHSAATGRCHTAEDSLELMSLLVSEVLREAVRWDMLLEEVVEQVTSLADTECKITAIGLTNVTNSLVCALKAGGHSSLSVKDHTAWNHDVRQARSGRIRNDKIAIVGMSGRFPEAASHEALWDLLMAGLDVHKEVPLDRFDPKAHCDPSGKAKNKSHTPYGCFINEPGLFDPRFFNMSPREAAQTDPMGRLGLVTAYEALEMAGYVPNRTPSTRLHRIGTFYGQTSDDWREINAAEDIDTYFITGGVRAFAPGRINYYFKFSGPSFSIDTACSSSFAAIQLACTSLWAGDCDTAVAGGLNVLTNPDIFAGLSKGQFLSKTGSCKTYDNDADGYCRGDGTASVILKRYEDAVADKDVILGSILATGTNHSAEAVSITHPHAGAQEFLFKKTLADAGIDAHEVRYVEMHGTGTQAGDGIEMVSVTNAFAPPHRRRRPDQPLYLGALKANIGHGEASSGINALIKTLMMLKNNKIPPNCGIKGVMNKSFPKDLAERRVHIPTSPVDFPRNNGELRKVFVNNFSAAGGNTSLLLEDGPLTKAPEIKDPRSTQVITVTARAISSLKKNINSLIDYVEDHPETTLTSLAYTSTARRIQHNYRVAIAASDMSQVVPGLKAQLKESYSPVAMVPTTVAFAFTGQGSQYTGLGQKLYTELPSFRADIDWLDDLATSQGLPSFSPLVNGKDVTTLTPVVIQLGMSCIQVALARMWASWGVKPLAVIGHSLGEYAALCTAGVISASDMVRLVGRRAELLVQNCSEFTHGMLAVKSSEAAIQQVLGAKMTEVACKNGPEETVLCGDMSVVSTAGEMLTAKGFKSTMLKVPFAFHSAQVEAILDEFRDVAKSVTFQKPTVPILSPSTGGVIRESGVIGAEYLARHARETVDFWTALATGEEDGVFNDKTAWLEIGAHPICTNMVKNSLESAPTCVPSLRRGEDAWKTITGSIASLFLAGVPFNFDEYHRDFNEAQELYILPTYSFDNKNYWLDYHNNWCLTKGEAPAVREKATELLPAPMKSKLCTTSCQRIVREDLKTNSGTVIVRSDITDPKLFKACTGHLVNENPLCPSSLYADQALTIAHYLYNELRPGAPEIGLNVCSMEVHKPLVAKVPAPPEGQFLEMEATANLDSNRMVIKYRSVSPDGTLLVEHGHCKVKYEDKAAWQENWDSVSFMVQHQIRALKTRADNGGAHKVLRGMAYKLFKSFVNYSTPFRGMEEVIFDGKDTEATATVQFQTTPEDGEYFCAPFWIDSLAHISGFICNGTDLIDNDESTFISHGWGSMRFAESFSPKKKYQSYVRMLPKGDKVRAGDVYIFDGDVLVGVVGQLKFQEIPRRLMNAMLPPPKKADNPTKPAVKAASVPALKEPPVKPNPKATRQKKVKPASKPSGSVVSKVMNIIAEETDVDMAELVDDAAFDNLGVDSLLSLTISAKLREDLELDIPSTLFTDNETIGALKKHFSQYDGEAAAVDDDSETSDGIDELVSPLSEECLSTPPSSAPSIHADDEKPVTAGAGDVSVARQVVADEMGVLPADIADEADLAEMGMDSLMSLTILSALRDATGVDLPSTFLTTNGTLEQIEEALGMRSKRPKAASKPKAAPRESVTAELEQVSARLRVSNKDVSKCPKATSVCLQGNAKTASKKLFLFPDGSGSATSYISIPNIAPHVAVFGMNCPFMKTPKEFLIGIDGVATLYLNEMKRRQPEGPYHIGGWSAGGVVAYEVATQLIARGERVDKLILLDAPCPKMAKEPLPARLHHFFDEIGLLGAGGAGSSPDWLLPHFEYAIKALGEYVPQVMPKSLAPSTLAVWAREGVCGGGSTHRPPPPEVEGQEDPAPMRWLLDDRTDFGDNGWAKLLGEGTMRFAQVDGNHFTMMGEEHGQTLGRLIRQGLGIIDSNDTATAK